LVLETPCFGLLFHARSLGSIDNSITSGSDRLALELLPPGGMLKRLGRRLLDLIDSVPLGWLAPSRRPIPVRIRRPRNPYLR